MSKQPATLTRRDIASACVHFSRYGIEETKADDGAIVLSIMPLNGGDARFGISRWPDGLPKAGYYYAFNRSGRVVAQAPTMPQLLAKRALQ